MLDAISLGREKQLYNLWAYVVMPEHVHIVLQPQSEVRISEILKSIKQSVSRRAIEWLKINEPNFTALDWSW